MAETESGSSPDDPQPRTSGTSGTSGVVRGGDRILRALTNDGAFRVITLSSTESVRAAIETQKDHGAKGELARLFADLLTGAVLVRESMAPDLRVQIILQAADGKSRIVADAQPDGSCRGVLLLPHAADGSVMPPAPEVFTSEGALLQVARTLQNGAIQQGVVSVSGGVSEALMQYMQQSEQVVTMCAVGNWMPARPDAAREVLVAGGYLVQLLPEVVEGPLMVMTERLKDFTSIDHLLATGKAEPEVLMSELLYGLPYTKVAERNDLRFACTCSPTRVAATLATLPKADIEDLLRDGRLLDIECDYCHTRYEFPPEQLRGMLERN